MPASDASLATGERAAWGVGAEVGERAACAAAAAGEGATRTVDGVRVERISHCRDMWASLRSQTRPETSATTPAPRLVRRHSCSSELAGLPGHGACSSECSSGPSAPLLWRLPSFATAAAVSYVLALAALIVARLAGVDTALPPTLPPTVDAEADEYESLRPRLTPPWLSSIGMGCDQLKPRQLVRSQTCRATPKNGTDSPLARRPVRSTTRRLTGVLRPPPPSPPPSVWGESRERGSGNGSRSSEISNSSSHSRAL